MPELPEVESIRRELLDIEGKRIIRANASDALLFPDGSLELYEKSLEHSVVSRVLRRGKYLVLKFGQEYLIYSLRMTGKIILVKESPLETSYEKLRLQIEDETRDLIFGSVRRFSRFYWHEGPLMEQENLARLGPDPLNGKFTWERFQQQFQNRTAPIKTLLLDQGFVAGVGNIYANEILFLAGIDPERPADELEQDEKRDLFEHLPELLENAADAGGSSFTNFIGASGEPGTFHRQHRVYDREGEPCPNCEAPVEKIVLSNRSTYFCSQCQK